MLPLLLSLLATCADPVPYFRPIPPAPLTVAPHGPPVAHPIARSCAIDDAACVERHDTDTLTAALMWRDPAACERATSPAACRAAYDLAAGDLPPLELDRCMWILGIDAGGTAQLWDEKADVIVRVPTREGWKRGTYVGRCSATTAWADPWGGS